MSRLEELKKAVENESRILMEVELKPLQGERFQPTGFPDIGPALYRSPDGRNMLLVESPQSMANRLEEVCWDHGAKDLKPELRGIPYVRATKKENGEFLTSSVLEAHRLNSPYLLVKGKELDSVLKERAHVGTVGIPDISLFARILSEFDLFALLHGIFLSRKEYAGGRLRIPRALSAFIEAEDVEPVNYGGVKKDDVNPKGTTKEGYGHVPYHRTEFTARKITAYFNLDLTQMRSYFPDEPAFFDLLLALSFYKISGVLRDGLRLRTACDLQVKDVKAKRPESSVIEELASPDGHEYWKQELPGLIKPLAESKGWKVWKLSLTDGDLKKSAKNND